VGEQAREKGEKRERRRLQGPEAFDLLELAIDMRLSEAELWALAEEIAKRDLLEIEVVDRLKPLAALLRAVYLVGYADACEGGFRIHPGGDY
jgi:hypothetical protein